MEKTLNLTFNTTGILTITINRPKAMNALNIALLNEIDQTFDDVYSNDEIKAVIITGSEEKAFAAGADISELQSLSTESAQKFATAGQNIFFKIENCPKPVIAAVNGFSLGGGCELAMACHLRGATPNAKFGQPEINLGIIPGYGGTQRLTQLIGKARSIELQLTSRMINAEQALEWGLINFVSSTKEELLQKSTEMLQTIISKAPIAITEILKSVNGYYHHQTNGYQVEANGFGVCAGTDDFKEGVAAFLEKRAAKFTGK